MLQIYRLVDSASYPEFESMSTVSMSDVETEPERGFCGFDVSDATLTDSFDFSLLPKNEWYGRLIDDPICSTFIFFLT